MERAARPGRRHGRVAGLQFGGSVRRSSHTHPHPYPPPDDDCSTSRNQYRPGDTTVDRTGRCVAGRYQTADARRGDFQAGYAPPPIVIPTEAAALKYEFAFIPATCPSPDPEGPCNLQNGILCHHSGSKHIRVTVYDSYYDPYSQRVGGKVRFSHAPDGAPIEPDETTQSNGVAEKTLSSDSDAPDMNNGTYYAWVVDTNGNRISEMSGAVTLNGKRAEESGMCTIADVFFAGGKK